MGFLQGSEATAIVAIDVSKLTAYGQAWQTTLEELESSGIAFDTLEREAWGAKQLLKVHEGLKAIEADRKELKAPVIRDGKLIDETAAKASGPGERLKAWLEAALAVPVQARKLAQEAAHQELAALVASGDSDAVQDALAALEDHVKIEGTSSREKWSFAVTSLADVPREYLVVNERAVRAYLKTNKVDPSIPGITFTSSTKVQPTGARK